MRVDIHTHILPGIDDGARDVEESMQMLKMLRGDRVTDVVLTPHFYFHEQSIEMFLEQRNAAYQRLCSRVSRGMKFHLGAEVEFPNISIDYGMFHRLAINDGRYILLELPYKGGLEKDVLPRVEKFIDQTGMQPIIAHVERYQGIADKPGLAADLIDMGCLLQVNATSVMESRRGTLVDALLRHGQVHLLGTDCHNTTFRKPALRPALVRIGLQYGMECRNYMQTIAEDVINGIPVRASADGRIRKILGKYR